MKKKVVRLTESDVEKLVERILKEDVGNYYVSIEEALGIIKRNPQEYPIDHIAKELGNQTYEVLGLSPFQALKGYRIKKISMFVWGLFDKRVRDQQVAQLKVNDKREIVDFKIRNA